MSKRAEPHFRALRTGRGPLAIITLIACSGALSPAARAEPSPSARVVLPAPAPSAAPSVAPGAASAAPAPATFTPSDSPLLAYYDNVPHGTPAPSQSDELTAAARYRAPDNYGYSGVGVGFGLGLGLLGFGLGFGWPYPYYYGPRYYGAGYGYHGYYGHHGYGGFHHHHH